MRYYDNSALMAEQYYPQSHVLNLPKNNGQTVQASWPVRNPNASGTRYARLVLTLGGQNDVVGQHIGVLAGQTITLANVSLTVNGQTPGAVVAGALIMEETTSTGGFIANIAVHGYSVLVGGGGGGGALVAVGDPQIF